MELEFGNVKLRAIENRDQELLRILINSPAVEAMTLGWHLPVSGAMQEKWISNYTNSDTEMRWMIELANGKTLGMVMLTETDWKNRNTVMGIKTNPYEKQRMEGDTKNASYAVIRYAFRELGLHRIESHLLNYNIFSRKLNESLGFQPEGILRSKIFKNNRWNDVCCYALLKDEYIDYEDGKAPWQAKERSGGK